MTEEDTYNKLRRIDYEMACVEYTMAVINLSSTVPEEVRIAHAEPALRAVGWTYADLLEESRRREWSFTVTE
jgi:hypothetical protein